MRDELPTAFLEKGEPLRERSPQHSVSTKGLGPCASQPGGPFSSRTAVVWQLSIHDRAYRLGTTTCRCRSPGVDSLRSEPCGFEAPYSMHHTACRLPRIPLLETVWKVLGERDGGLRFAPCTARDIPRICPTTNGAVSARIFPNTRGKDARGFMA